MIDVIIVEDNIYMQNHLAGAVEADGRCRLVGVFRDAFEAEAAAENPGCDVVLMDVQTLHNHSGLAAGGRIRKNGRAKVVIVTSLVDPEVLSRAKSGDADSLWYKDHGDAELMDVVARTFEGERIFPDEAPSVELKDMFSKDISPRQMEILRRFVKGLTYDEIAEELGLSKNGVRWNLNEIVEKGGFHNKHELLAAVIENKLIVTTLRDE